MIQNPQGPVANVVTVGETGICENLTLTWLATTITTSYGVTPLAKKLFIID